MNKILALALFTLSCEFSPKKASPSAASLKASSIENLSLALAGNDEELIVRPRALFLTPNGGSVASLRPDEAGREILTLKNPQDAPLSIKRIALADGVGGKWMVSPESLDIASQETATISISIESVEPGLHQNKLILSGNFSEISIPVFARGRPAQAVKKVAIPQRAWDMTTPFVDRVSFLYGSENRVQNTEAGILLPERVALVTGYTHSFDPEIALSVVDHPEFGIANMPDLDGSNSHPFMMAVNGGDSYIFKIERPGSVPLFRPIFVEKNSYTSIGTNIGFTDRSYPILIQQAAKTHVYEYDMVVPAKTGFTLRTAEGDLITLDQAQLRRTIYSPDAEGITPVPFPLNISSTLAFDISAIECEVLACRDFHFNNPITFYLDAKISEIPVASGVPIARIDNGQITPVPTGRVVDVLDQSGSVGLDVDGDGQIDETSDVIPTDELRSLSGQINQGRKWRVTLKQAGTYIIGWPIKPKKKD